MKKILLLTDFSKASKKAILFAQTLFSDAASEFHLLHSYTVDTSGSFGDTTFHQEAEKQVRQQLNSLLSEITTQPVPDHHRYLTRTYPNTTVDAVEWILSKEHFDYVVLGATGRGNNEYFGSVATSIIRTVKTSVLVVPETVPSRPVQRVVLATDYHSVNHLRSLRPLKELLTMKGANLTFLTINGPEHDNSSVSEKSQQFAAYFDTINTDAFSIRNNEVERGIDEYLATHPVDLLVTVPHHRSLLDLVTGRSITRKLAYKPRVPLLTVYDPEDLPIEIDEKDVYKAG
ncbi:hypothetical protein GCM10023189_03770 [Nibrella saemangeumensis]|uniref:UspA domain-containing protein n=1 Tax=Nibrella saemangeumensis TaxID=1084526 RepID=A0ABP8MCN8_9BACT